MEDLERQIKTIECKYAQPDFYFSTSAEQLGSFHNLQRQLQDQLTDAILDWEALETEISVLERELRLAGSSGEI